MSSDSRFIAKQFLIRSCHAEGIATNFTTSLSNLLWSQDCIFKIIPRVIMFPNVVYNVHSATNTLVVDGTPYVFPDGFYTFDSWVTMLQGLLPVNTFTSITVDPYTGVIVFTSGSSHTLSYAGSTMARMIGLTSDMVGTTISLSEIPAFNFPNAAYMYAEWAQSNTITERNQVTTLVDIISFDSAAWGETITHVHQDIDIHSVDFNDTRNFSQFRIFMLDKWDNPLVLAPGASVEILFKAFIRQ